MNEKANTIVFNKSLIAKVKKKDEQFYKTAGSTEHRRNSNKSSKINMISERWASKDLGKSLIGPLYATNAKKQVQTKIEPSLKGSKERKMTFH